MITGKARNVQTIPVAEFSATQTAPWQAELRHMITRLDDLREAVGLTSEPPAPLRELNPDFPVRTTRLFAGLMEPGNWHDPLLRQVLPWAEEDTDTPGYTADPLGEEDATAVPGLIHKYRSRVLLVPTSSCAIHCRYCFRRHFPYEEHKLGKQDRERIVAYLHDHPDVNEVIMSGGDPLMLNDKALSHWLDELETVPSIKRVRFHTRLPIVLPQRLTNGLRERLMQSRLQVILVVHANHPREISDSLSEHLHTWRGAVTLLNQTVMLQGVNDDADTLCELSEKLFNTGILPYYLHHTDPIAGTAHFTVPLEQTRSLHEQMKAQLPGFLVPRLVEEIAGEPNKTWL